MDHGTFLGWIGDDVLHLLYRIADVCVVPSIYEPFGLVALEAMASGCPCIVADTGGLREVVPHGEVGLRFHTRDPEALGRWSSACSPSRADRAPDRRGVRARPALRLERRGGADGRDLRGAGGASRPPRALWSIALRTGAAVYRVEPTMAGQRREGQRRAADVAARRARLGRRCGMTSRRDEEAPGILEEARTGCSPPRSGTVAVCSLGPRRLDPLRGLHRVLPADAGRSPRSAWRAIRKASATKEDERLEWQVGDRSTVVADRRDPCGSSDPSAPPRGGSGRR